MKALRGIGSALGQGLSAGLLLLIVGLGIIAIGVPALTGGIPLSILTGSMTPTLPPGTLVVVRPTPVEDIQPGDVLTFQLDSGEPALVTHRVIARQAESTTGEIRFITQGDANDAPDPRAVLPVQVRGTVWYAVPYLGWANQAIDGAARAWVVPVMASGLFAYGGLSVVAGVRDRRRSAAARQQGLETRRSRTAPARSADA